MVHIYSDIAFITSHVSSIKQNSLGPVGLGKMVAISDGPVNSGRTVRPSCCVFVLSCGVSLPKYR